METIAHGRTMAEWCREFPVLAEVIAGRECCWHNPAPQEATAVLARSTIPVSGIEDASRRLARFGPLIARLFPETAAAGGLIESPLRPIPAMQRHLRFSAASPLPGALLLKCDHLLPVSGSIKARGGIHEVLQHAEELAISHGLLRKSEDYGLLAGERFREFFGKFRLAVGSTGNLGLSIGMMGARLGFQVTVHMSAEARRWKKELLRSLGVRVIEYGADYGAAVAAGRAQAVADPACHFIDDENSAALFLGYAVAGERLAAQLAAMDIEVDVDHPLFVYLPCGVGGGPGGITFGLKHRFGDHVHCIFAEPTQSPCMLLGLCTGLHEQVCVQDFGLDNRTGADGLAVARPSGLVGRLLAPLIDGVCTVSEENMYRLLALLADSENIRLEPSALAGMGALERVAGDARFLRRHGPAGRLAQATHIVWGTGGSMVPPEEMEGYYRRGIAL